MATNLANLALDGGDPRMGEKNPANFAFDHGHEGDLQKGQFSIEAALVHNDKSVLFEEYLHYAQITRAEEHAVEGNNLKTKDPWSIGGLIKNRFSKGHVQQDASAIVDENGNIVTTDHVHANATTVTDGEWRRASRAVRTASWSSIFFLITTDILGPSGAAWAFQNLGYGPGVALYTVFGFFAAISGWYIWGVYMHMDSDRHPLRDFGQAYFRVFGQGMRHFINVLQSLQMLMLVAVLVLNNGAAISQVSIGNNGVNGNGLCYVICILIFALCGMVIGQIRTLQRYGWLANASVWMTVTTAFVAISAAAIYEPDYEVIFGTYGGAGTAYGDTNFPNHTVESHIPIKLSAGTPPDGYAQGGVGFAGTFEGVDSIIYAYGGAMIFFNLLSEMRNPWDFWKGMLCADIFIYLCYMFFGIFQYSYQGQYTYVNNYQSTTAYAYTTAGNILSILGGLIAAGLYGNIGIKVVYNNVFMELFGFPPLSQKGGKILWIVVVPVYWAISFIVGAAIPDIGGIYTLVGAFCIGNFTYTFPPLLKLGFDIQKAAMLPEEHFDETTKKYVRLDEGWRRYARGFRKGWLLNSFNIIYFLGALVVCGLGSWAAILSLMSFFDGAAVTTSFSCVSPYAG